MASPSLVKNQRPLVGSPWGELCNNWSDFTDDSAESRSTRVDAARANDYSSGVRM
jgi:hypothetical protein